MIAILSEAGSLVLPSLRGLPQLPDVFLADTDVWVALLALAAFLSTAYAIDPGRDDQEGARFPKMPGA